MSVSASNTALHVSPRKVGEVAALIRGRSVADALVILEHTPRRSALALQKLLISAQANAVHNHGYEEEGLVISTLEVGPGFSLKRYRPAAHGRALPYRRRTSIVKVSIDGHKKAPKKSRTPRKSSTKSSKSAATKSDNIDKKEKA